MSFRNHSENMLVRILLRAIWHTKSLDRANLIVMGDYCAGATIDEKIVELSKIYKLTTLEVLDIKGIFSEVA